MKRTDEHKLEKYTKKLETAQGSRVRKYTRLLNRLKDK